MGNSNIVVKSYSKLPKSFIDLPKSLHNDLPNYIAPLDLDVRNTLDFSKNPYWTHTKHLIFIAYKNGKPCGRGMAIYNPNYIEVSKKSHGFFGYLDSCNDTKIFQALTSEIEHFLKSKGCTKMIGPVNPSINYELGVLSQGYDVDPYFMMNYNPPYYLELYKNNHFKKEMSFYAYHVPNEINQNKLNRIKQLVFKRYQATIVEFDYKNFKNEVSVLREIYNDAFEGHFGYLPISEEEFQYLASDMKFILDKDLLYKVEVNGDTAGFILALPNLNEVIKKMKNGKLNLVNIIRFLYYKRKIKNVKVFIAAIKHKYQHMGLGSLLYSEMADRVKNNGYAGGELSWVAEDNVQMNKAIASMGGKKTKTYQLFQKDI